MEKSQVAKVSSNPFFIHSTDPIHLSFGQDTDGLEILASSRRYRPLTKEKNGLRL
jgi:hypothetical protein